MVKKLFKHEFLAMGRLILPLIIGILGIGTLTRLIYLFESDTLIFNIVGISAFVLLFIGILSSLVLCTVFGIIRFYKNLFSSEGYLSFTLPVTPTQHLVVKLLTAVTCFILTVIASFASLCIAFSGEALVEIFKAIGFIFNSINEYVIGASDTTLYIVEFILLLLFSVFYMFLLFYTCITIGQTAKKGRIGKAIATYFIYYGITQVVGTVLIIVNALLGDKGILTFAINNPELFVHAFFCAEIAVISVLSLVFFLISRHIMNKKLNIE